MEPLQFVVAASALQTLERIALYGFGVALVLVLVCAITIAVLLRGYLRIIVDLFLNRSQIPGVPDPEVRLPGEPVEFQTEDGVTLRGMFLAASNGDGRTIIFCHEYGSNRNSVTRYYRFLGPAGFNVLAFDFRGHGESGNANGYVPKQWMTTYEMADLEAAIRYVQKRPDVDPRKIGLLGLSMGACTCIAVASRNEAVRAVVAEGTFSTRWLLIEGMKRWVSVYAVLTPVHPWLPDGFFRWLCRVAMQRAEEAQRCRFVAIEDLLPQVAPRPLLLIHGEKDSYVSVAHAQRLLEQARPPKWLWVVPGARHNEGVRVAGEEYARRVTDFFRQYLT